MELAKFSHDLQAFYQEMGEAFSSGQARSGLPCLPGCGQCCLIPEVEASLLEMIPMAFKLVDEGRGESVLEELMTIRPKTCWAYVRHSSDGILGQCGQYETRPSICREFGVAGMSDKDGRLRVSVCKHIRTNDPERVERALDAVADWAPPLMHEWSMRLLQLHPEILNDRRPISMALAEALNKVLLYKDLKDHQA